jgi:uncharacterized membrane protein
VFRLLWDKLQTTIWFIPATLSLTAVVAAMLLVNLDPHSDTGGWSWLNVFKIGAAGVRQVLAVTTGAMMTITGVVFSVSVVTLTLAANQFGAKILRNYLGDSRNKVVLGLFVGSFLYGLIVLASIDSDSGGDVPTVAFMVGLLLTLVAIAGLIYFIHNISTSIQADRVIAVIGRNLCDTVGDSLSAPGEQGDPPPLGDKWRLAVHNDAGVPVDAGDSGYIEYIDYDALLDIASQGQCAIEITTRPGLFVIQGNPLATLHALGAQPAVPATQIRRRISIGGQRTAVQDLEYAFMQLLQIAQRALSPGINDALTAIACIDWLGAALAGMAVRRYPPQYRVDAGGTVRLKIHAFDFSGAVNAVFNPLRQSARGNEMVTIHLLEIITAIMQVIDRETGLDDLRRHADLILHAAQTAFPEPEDIRITEQRHGACMAVFQRRKSTNDNAALSPAG